MDPTTQTALTTLFGFLPAPYSAYAASAVGIAGILSILASAISASVKPPSATTPKWLLIAYQVVTWPAFNLGWARNAVVPGMPAVVQVAAKDAAALAAAVPHLTTVAEPPAISGVIAVASAITSKPIGVTP